MWSPTYLSGFGNSFSSEALPNTLPSSQNSPQRCPSGLYAEQINGTAFTAPRHLNQRSWLYKLRPSVSGQTAYVQIPKGQFSNDFASFVVTPTQLRWKELPLVNADSRVDFVQGISTMAGIGDPAQKSGLAIYMYSCNASMENKAFYSSDGDFLIVPEQGTLSVKTELGRLTVSAQEMLLIPRGIKFSVYVDSPCRGYISEVFSGHLRLPELGPIGANGLANARDFQCPTAWFEDLSVDFTVINKFSGELFEYRLPHSVFDTVAWHGTYYPLKYDLRHYNAMGTVTYDHPDPCIFTVLTCQSAEPGTAVLDFVIFPPRWMVAEHTFRPPYYHRNTMTEFMGNIVGSYDAKTVGFTPGTASLHSCMSAHGPEAAVFDKGTNAELAPVRYPDNHLQFMFETCYMLRLAPWAMERNDEEYLRCWGGLNKLHVSE
jgi:homogentisate 1,2-dioxygenase